MMPHSSLDQMDVPKKGKAIKSAYDSMTFDHDLTIHVDGRVGSATISPCGRDVALASPDGLAIIDLDSPYNPPRRLRSHGLPWLVVDVQWSPFSARDYWVVSTANHRALVWNLNLRDDSPSGAIEHSLQGHNRAITDVNFSAHHPDLLATCSVDGYVHCWDLRRPRQPVVTFCDWFAGGTQVKYNRQDPFILASSHDRVLHIWDERRPSQPLKSINAHDSKIYGIDWNRVRSTAVVTCSLDKSIKYWDYNQDGDSPERVIRTDFPIWRARHTPFGDGLLAMPQTEPGNLFLYHNKPPPGTPVDGKVEPAFRFAGHGKEKVREFLWRSRGGISDDRLDDREFQLVTWGEDNELRLENLDPSILASIDYVKGSRAPEKLGLTRKGAVYKTFRTVGEGGHRDRGGATMSDSKAAAVGPKHYQSALTLGMRTMPLNRSRIGTAWRGTSMTAKSANSKDPKGSLAQIGWMKGVTMTKRKPSGADREAFGRRHSSKGSSMFSHGYLDEWGEPETIQDEVVRITQQLPKVKWDSVNMDSLTLEASLNGPWGVDGASIFFKVKVDVPANYPKSKPPKFTIEKTSLMPPETHKAVESEIQKLAQRFSEKKQNCLWVALSYLLGDVDLEASTSFFRNVKDLDDDIGGLADESSSEDEDTDARAGGSASISQELMSSAAADNSLAPTIRMPTPPPPRLCGARFSHDGRLVCFFPTKEEKIKAPFLTPEGILRERVKGEPFFPGFGRMIPESPLRQRNTQDDTSATEDQSGSDESGSSTSSSDSESTSLHKSSLWYHGRSLRKTWSGSRSIRSSGGGTGVGTGTGTGASRRRPAKPKNILSIYDLRNDLPSKKEFAEEYLIFGDGAEVCTHNAKVAEKYGRQDLVDIWNYAALMLRKGIPLELVSHGHSHNQDSVLVIARDVLSRLQDADADSSADGGSDISLDQGSNLAGRVKWGHHPLATEFVKDLLTYFEKIADVQMLAMLSCIFSESSKEETVDPVAYLDANTAQPETPLPLKTPSFSLDYFPADVTNLLVFQHGRSQNNSAINTPKIAHTPIHYSGSQFSDDGLWTGEPGSNSYSCGETPPMKMVREYLGDIDQTQSLSSSPNTRGFKRMNSGLAASLANLPRTFAQSVSSSPPSQLKKRPSPGETILSNLAPRGMAAVAAWGPPAVLDESGGTARTSMSDDDYREEFLPLVPMSVAVEIEDQTIFDDDGWLVLPLLEPDHTAMYASYRYAYAEMLHLWGQPLARLEVMKFNVLKTGGGGRPTANNVDASSHTSYSVTATESGTQTTAPMPSSPILLGRKEQLQALVASGRGLDVTGICRVHETQLEPLEYTAAASTAEPGRDGIGGVGGAVGTCDRCRRSQRQLRCVYCLGPVDALYPPCLSCGCASHEGCLAEWHAAGETQCPAGDECNCVEAASSGQVETWAAIMGAITRMRGGGRRGSALANIGALLPVDGAGGPRGEDTRREGAGEKEVEKTAGGKWDSGRTAASTTKSHKSTSSSTSAARLSLGNRLKKVGGDLGVPQKKSGGPWRKRTG